MHYDHQLSRIAVSLPNSIMRQSQQNSLLDKTCIAKVSIVTINVYCLIQVYDVQRAGAWATVSTAATAAVAAAQPPLQFNIVNPAMPFTTAATSSTNTTSSSISEGVRFSTAATAAGSSSNSGSSSRRRGGSGAAEVCKLAMGEAVTSLAWLPGQSSVLVAGTGTRWLRLFDMRARR
jgi:hypothetical protein